MTDFLNDIGLSDDVIGKIAATIVATIVILLLRWLIVRIVKRKPRDPETVFRTRKAVGYGAGVIFVITAFFIWVPSVSDLATWLGLVSAGVAIALSPILLDMAAWMYLVVRRPFEIGDRVEIGVHAGDVIDIRVLRFSILEIGNWVDADQPTGRIIHVPNGMLFSEPLANFTEGFERIWLELSVLITFESDWAKAESLMRAVLESHTEDRTGEQRELRRAAQRYLIPDAELDPSVFVEVKDSGVSLTARLFVDARRRREVEDLVWREILTAFAAEPSVQLAYPTVRTYLPDAVRVQEGDGS